MRIYRAAVIGALAACLVLFTAGPAAAGDYHTLSTLYCNDCHIMHGQQSHGYSSDGTGLTTPIGGAAPYDYLLRNEPNDLCLTCHNGTTFAPDVLEANTGSNVRNAGALNESGAAPYYNATGHTLGSTTTAPGGTWSNSTGLECVNCHTPHGGATAYRNLSSRAGPGGATVPTYAIGANDPNKDVYEIASGGATHYDISNVNYNMPNAAASAMGKFCSVCHTDFYGTVGGTQVGGTGSPASDFHRHPSAGAIIGAATGGHSKKESFAWGQRTGGPIKVNWVKVMTATNNWEPNDPTMVGWDYSPSCFSCHKSHGNQNAFGLVYMNPLAGTKTEEGTNPGTYRNLCNQCHSQGL